MEELRIKNVLGFSLYFISIYCGKICNQLVALWVHQLPFNKKRPLGTKWDSCSKHELRHRVQLQNGAFHRLSHSDHSVLGEISSESLFAYLCPLSQADLALNF